MKTDLIILSAGDIRDKFSFLKYKAACPALIPINSRSLLSYTLEFYAKHDFRSKYLVLDDTQQVRTSVELKALLVKYDVNPLYIQDSVHVNQSLSLSLNLIKKDGQELLINLVTTIPNQVVPSNTVLVGEELSKNIGWSVIDKDNFYSKNNKEKRWGYPFTGIMKFSYDELNDSLSYTRESSDLMDTVKMISSKSKVKILKSKWLDCGHEENYSLVKHELINSRFFNNLTVNNFGFIEKSSVEIEKLRQEVFFNQNLPSELAYLVPRTNDLIVENGSVKYSMEYYPIPNLAEIVLYWDLKDYVFENLFQTIELILKKFISFDYSLSKKEYCQFYIVKLDERLKSFYNHNTSLSLMSEEIYINGIRCLSPQQLMPWITQNIHDLYDENHLGIMHGDLCFNNILYDFSNDILKLIDPRGKFSDEMSIYGDMKYDLAKIIHSSVYHYDYIVNDLYELNTSVNSEYTYQFALRDNDFLLKELSFKLVENLGVDFQQIEFIVGMLFLSMAALHKDDESRQLLMYLHGLKILNENCNGEKENLS